MATKQPERCGCWVREPGLPSEKPLVRMRTGKESSFAKAGALQYL